jgi:hypothetical protein
MQNARIHFCEDNISRLARVPFFFFTLSKIHGGIQNRLDSIYNNFPRVVARRTRIEVCGLPVRSPKRRFGIIVSSAVEHGAEPPKTPCRPPLRTTDTDGIKSSVARGGWYGELKFSIASSALRGRFCIRRN